MHHFVPADYPDSVPTLSLKNKHNDRLSKAQKSHLLQTMKDEVT